MRTCAHLSPDVSWYCQCAQPNSEEKILIGHQARFSEDDSLKALDAATKSWAMGRGEWAQTSPAVRIKKVEELVAELKPLRDQIINVLMWEICKTKADATKVRPTPSVPTRPRR